MATFSLTPTNSQMPPGNTPMEDRGTTVLPSGFSHRGFPEAVEQHIRRTDTCHLWYGFTNRQGYPEIQYDSYRFSARRWIYEYAHDTTVGKGLNAMPSCGNVMCVHPEHLEEKKAVKNVSTAITGGSQGMSVPSRASSRF